MSAPKPGAVTSWSRSFSEADIRAFAELSGDKGRHHLERDEKGRLMAHGLLTATLPTKLGGDLHYIAADMTFEFLRPVYADEELLCLGTIETVKAEPRRWAVSFSFVVTNPNKKRVLTGTTHGVIYREQRRSKKASKPSAAAAPPVVAPVAAPAAPARRSTAKASCRTPRPRAPRSWPS